MRVLLLKTGDNSMQGNGIFRYTSLIYYWNKVHGNAEDLTKMEKYYKSDNGINQVLNQALWSHTMTI